VAKLDVIISDEGTDIKYIAEALGVKKIQADKIKPPSFLDKL
jgi:hypothetical protein